MKDYYWGKGGFSYGDSGNFDDSPLTTTTKKGAFKVSCFENHEPLKIGKYEIHGGSCIRPAVKDADVYIGFDSGMSLSKMSWPWDKKGDEVYFYIRDMGVPDNAGDFIKLIHWTEKQLEAGRKVHAGCIGGHGRTGTFFAALVTHMTGELDSITYVRKHYCHKAVESSQQIDFLNKHFSIKRVEGSKANFGFAGGTVRNPAKVAEMPKRGVVASQLKKVKATIIQSVKSDKALW